VNSGPLLLAIIGHLVGDYLLQNDWMAAEKKRDWFVAFIHATIWAMAVLLFSGWGSFHGTHGLIVAACLIIPHAIQDHSNLVRWWMRLIGQRVFSEPPMAPWSIIVVDNVWHIVTLWVVWRFVA